jgi:hypothetical protein
VATTVGPLKTHIRIAELNKTTTMYEQKEVACFVIRKQKAHDMTIYISQTKCLLKANT